MEVGNVGGVVEVGRFGGEWLVEKEGVCVGL